MTNYGGLLEALSAANVRFIVIGGLAETVHGSSRFTSDVDVVYERSTANLERISQALAPYEPYLRGAPKGLPFRLDVPTLRAGLNFTLITTKDLEAIAELQSLAAKQAKSPHKPPSPPDPS